MAVYKVPQDVEADDKLIGPFSFRQFVYLLIAGGLVALAVGLFQIFPLLAVIPVPFILLLLALALPLKKDQPMETYLAALVSYYLKPRMKRWTPGQRESAILITAPKIVEETRTRDLSEEEATSRLSFLADIVDTGGYAIRGNNNMREDLVAEANATADMFENYEAERVSRAVNRDTTDRHMEAIRNMREAIERNEEGRLNSAQIIKDNDIRPEAAGVVEKPVENSVDKSKFVIPEMRMPNGGNATGVANATGGAKTPGAAEKVSTSATNNSIIELANNPEYSVATIAKEANRIKRKDEGEIFISLH